VLLADVPLHDVWQVELPNGGPDRTIAEIRSLISAKSLAEVNPFVRALLGLRRLLGKIFGWDSSQLTLRTPSYLSRLAVEDRMSSLVEPGTADGPFTVLYVHPREAVSEIRNATVHAFSALALEPLRGGYRLYCAIYVAPVGRLTAFYMALIDPFRRLLVYPAILGHLHRAWLRAHPGATAQ
jgi:hypothetical protein